MADLLQTYLNVSLLLDSEADNFNGMLLVNTLKDTENLLLEYIKKDPSIDEKTKQQMQSLKFYKSILRLKR